MGCDVNLIFLYLFFFIISELNKNFILLVDLVFLLRVYYWDNNVFFKKKKIM